MGIHELIKWNYNLQMSVSLVLVCQKSWRSSVESLNSQFLMVRDRLRSMPAGQSDPGVCGAECLYGSRENS